MAVNHPWPRANYNIIIEVCPVSKLRGSTTSVHDRGTGSVCEQHSIIPPSQVQLRVTYTIADKSLIFTHFFNFLARLLLSASESSGGMPGLPYNCGSALESSGGMPGLPYNCGSASESSGGMPGLPYNHGSASESSGGMPGLPYNQGRLYALA